MTSYRQQKNPKATGSGVDDFSKDEEPIALFPEQPEINALVHLVSWYHITRSVKMRSEYSIGSGSSRESFQTIVESIEETNKSTDQNNDKNNSDGVDTVDSGDEYSPEVNNAEVHSPEDTAILSYTSLVS